MKSQPGIRSEITSGFFGFITIPVFKAFPPTRLFNYKAKEWGGMINFVLDVRDFDNCTMKVRGVHKTYPRWLGSSLFHLFLL